MRLYAEKAIQFVDGLTEDSFHDDERTQFAVVRAIEVIGEASKGVPPEVQILAPEIP